MRTARPRAVSRAKGVIGVVLASTVAFSLYLAYVAWSSSSFPAEERPFSNYASVASTQFNGTEIMYRVRWNAPGGFLPLYAQITSPQTDEANSPVCDIASASVAPGQNLSLPFRITAPKQSLASVDLAIAVRATSNSTEFTIVYHIGEISAQPGDMTPSSYSCSQPASASM